MASSALQLAASPAQLPHSPSAIPPSVTPLALSDLRLRPGGPGPVLLPDGPAPAWATAPAGWWTVPADGVAENVSLHLSFHGIPDAARLLGLATGGGALDPPAWFASPPDPPRAPGVRDRPPPFSGRAALIAPAEELLRLHALWPGTMRAYHLLAFTAGLFPPVLASAADLVSYYSRAGVIATALVSWETQLRALEMLKACILSDHHVAGSPGAYWVAACYYADRVVAEALERGSLAIGPGNLRRGDALVPPILAAFFARSRAAHFTCWGPRALSDPRPAAGASLGRGSDSGRAGGHGARRHDGRGSGGRRDGTDGWREPRRSRSPSADGGRGRRSRSPSHGRGSDSRRDGTGSRREPRRRRSPSAGGGSVPSQPLTLPPAAFLASALEPRAGAPGPRPPHQPHR